MAGKMEFICSFVNRCFHSCHSWNPGPRGGRGGGRGGGGEGGLGTRGNSCWECAVLFSKP